MRMGNFFGAFEEIPAPHLSGNAFQFSRKRLKQAEWDEKLQCPDGGLRNLLLNDGWKRCAYLYLTSDFPWQFNSLFETIRRAFRIDDVIAQKSSATIELEIEIATIGFGLGKKLDATIFPDFVEILCPHAANVTVIDLENPMDALFRVK